MEKYKILACKAGSHSEPEKMKKNFSLIYKILLNLLKKFVEKIMDLNLSKFQ